MGALPFPSSSAASSTGLPTSTPLWFLPNLETNVLTLSPTLRIRFEQRRRRFFEHGH